MNPVIRLLELLRSLTRRVDRWLALPYIARMKKAGKGVFLGAGVRIEHPECVSLGDGVHLSDFCWISILTENRETGRPALPLQPELTIGEHTYIGRFATLACINRVAIGSNVMISDRVFIGDALHGHARPDLPIKDQYMVSPGPVMIGDGTWIGINVSILPNVTIGRNCVIGANSVVTSDIPDYCVAAGAPARVLRKSTDT
jgi:acetyltransferase-like isoleucine patch superfamily enzyme